jgi:hypothetical protein
VVKVTSCIWYPEGGNSGRERSSWRKDKEIMLQEGLVDQHLQTLFPFINNRNLVTFSHFKSFRHYGLRRSPDCRKGAQHELISPTPQPSLFLLTHLRLPDYAADTETTEPILYGLDCESMTYILQPTKRSISKLLFVQWELRNLSFTYNKTEITSEYALRLMINALEISHICMYVHEK